MGGPESVSSFDAMQPRRRMGENFLLLWLDVDIDQSNKDYQDQLVQLQSVVHDVHLFTQRDECIDFLTDVTDMQAFLLVGGTMAQRIISLIDDIPQLHSMYLLCRNTSRHEEWTKAWLKVKGVHTGIASICQSIQNAIKQLNQGSIAVSFIGVSEGISSKNLNQLEPSFMYTQIFKEILLEIDHNRQSIQNFITYCRNGDYGSPTIITRFEKEYQAKLAIWWYTYPSFIYSLLNYALRMMDADTIIHMGFFIRDLHCQLEQLHQKQVSGYHRKPFIVYRGQGLSDTDFEKLRKTKGGLMSFNNFLSTSRDRDVSFNFAEIALTKTDTVGILFQITIDPSISSTPFAAIQENSYYDTEEEILFSMQTVFRTGDIKQMDNNNQLYQVELQLTSDDDPQLRTLTERIRDETLDSTGWKRLGQLLFKMGQFNKAEELYNALLEQTSDEGETAAYYHQLGVIRNGQGDYASAIRYYKEALEINGKNLPPSHLDLANSSNNIALVYSNMGEYLKALSFFEKAFGIYRKSLPQNHPDLATSNNNIGEVYREMGKYSKALSFFEKALEIQQKSLPPNHPLIATSNNNIASVYLNMGEYSKALSFFVKALEIHQKTLPPNHPSLATSNNNIASVYHKMGEHPKALSLHEKAQEIYQKTLPPNHPLLVASNNNIGKVYHDMGEYSKALSFYEKALQIHQKTLPQNHPDLTTSYNNIGLVYEKTGEYLKALSFLEKALEIEQKGLSPNHPWMATSNNNIALVYCNMGEYSKALSFLEKAQEIYQKTLSPNHPDLATSYNNIGAVNYNMGQYSKAVSFYEKALEIEQKSLPSNHPLMATSYYNIGCVYGSMREYSKALSYIERALDIYGRSLPPNHPDIQNMRRGIEIVKNEIVN